jgi:hypothetical protein
VEEVLGQLDRELVGLRPVKTRIRQIASLLLIERTRAKVGSPAIRRRRSHGPDVVRAIRPLTDKTLDVPRKVPAEAASGPLDKAPVRGGLALCRDSERHSSTSEHAGILSRH